MKLWHRSQRGSLESTPPARRGTSILADLRPWWLRVKEWYTSSYRTCDTGDDEPSWVSARRANLARCAFYRLPEELVLQILSSLDDISKRIALRTCGLIMRIMFDRTLLGDACEERIEARVWRLAEIGPWPSLSQKDNDFSPAARLKSFSFRKQLDRLLDRDRFCDACSQFRKDGRYDMAIQKLQSMLWCSHCNEAHRRPLFSSRQREFPSATRICVLAEGKLHICTHLSTGWKEAQDFKCPDSMRGIPWDLCQHRDHEPPLWTALSDQRHLYANSRPRVKRWKHVDNDTLMLSSTVTHKLFKLQHETPVTRAWLQEQLAANTTALEKILCPHVTVDDGQLLLPFAPDNCACFDCLRWINHSCVSYDRFCCRCNAERNPSQVGYFLAYNEAAWHQYWPSRHNYHCGICSARYTWIRFNSTVYLKIDLLNGSYDFRFPKYIYIDSSWLSVIHPEAWGILEDDELRHVAWCDDIFCASRWRWEQLLRLLVGMGPAKEMQRGVSRFPRHSVDEFIS